MVCREAPLRYTSEQALIHAELRYGLPGSAAEIHCTAIGHRGLTRLWFAGKRR